jgi:hypothetical protein
MAVNMTDAVVIDVTLLGVMKVLGFSETQGFTIATRRNIPEGAILRRILLLLKHVP